MYICAIFGTYSFFLKICCLSEFKFNWDYCILYGNPISLTIQSKVCPVQCQSLSIKSSGFMCPTHHYLILFYWLFVLPISFLY